MDRAAEPGENRDSFSGPCVCLGKLPDAPVPESHWPHSCSSAHTGKREAAGQPLRHSSVLVYFKLVTKPHPYLQRNGAYTEPYGFINDSLTSAQPVQINPRSLAICFCCGQTSGIFVYCTTKQSVFNCQSANLWLLYIWKAPLSFLSQKKKHHSMYFSLIGDFSAHCLHSCLCRGPLWINQCWEIKDWFITQWNFLKRTLISCSRKGTIVYLKQIT